MTGAILAHIVVTVILVACSTRAPLALTLGCIAVAVIGLGLGVSGHHHARPRRAP